MLGIIREYFNTNKYSHTYHEKLRTNTFHVYKHQSGYHLYDLIVFVIIFVFLGAYFYNILLIDKDNPSIGYIGLVVSVIAISAMMF
jgi:hypothetical protein